MYFLTVFIQIIIMFILIAIGFSLSKLKVWSEGTIKELTTFLLNIVSPALMIKAFVKPVTGEHLKNFGMVALATTIIYILSILMAKLLFALPKFKDSYDVPSYKFAATYSNCVFMGIPMIQAMLGMDGLFYAMPFITVNSIFLWSHGLEMFRNEKSSAKKTAKHILLNPNIIAITIGFIMFITNTISYIPGVIMMPIEYLSMLNTPLSMIVIGANFVVITEPIYKDKMSWLITLIRNVIYPLIFIGVLYLFPLNTDAKIAIMILSTAPIAGLIVMFNLINNRSTDFATRTLCLSTLTSAITMPLILMFCKFLFR